MAYSQNSQGEGGMMSNVLEAKVAIRGTRPLFWHAWGEDTIPLEAKERTGVAGNDPEEWRKTVLCTKRGQLYLPGAYVYACLAAKDGAAKLVPKKGRMTYLKDVASTVLVWPDRILVDRFMPGVDGADYDPKTADVPERDPELPVYLDVRRVTNKGSGAGNVRYRVAACLGWTCEFTLQWDKTVVPRDALESIMLRAGPLVGLGDGRRIGMGRFEVTEFTVVENDG